MEVCRCSRRWQSSLAIMVIAVLLLVPVSSGFCQGSPPQRIVSLGPMNTKNIYLLGVEDRLVANTLYCRFPEAAREKEKIGTVLQIDIEHILSLRPDLVLATGLTQPQQIDALRRLGLRVRQFREPRSFDEICSQFLELGNLLGLERRAEAILARVNRRLSAIRQSASTLPQPRVLLQIGANPLFAATSASFTDDYIALAGGVNIAAGEDSGRYSPEKALTQNPDVIVIAIMGGQTGLGSAEQEKWRKLSSIAAVKSGRVFLVDPDLVCSPTPESFIEGLTLFSQLLHSQSAERLTISRRE